MKKAKRKNKSKSKQKLKYYCKGKGKKSKTKNGRTKCAVLKERLRNLQKARRALRAAGY